MDFCYYGWYPIQHDYPYINVCLRLEGWYFDVCLGFFSFEAFNLRIQWGRDPRYIYLNLLGFAFGFFPSTGR